MTAHQDVAGVVEGLPERLRVNTCRYGYESEDAASRRRIATDLEAADLIESLSKALSEAEAERDAAFNKCAELCRESAKIHSAASALEISTSAKLKRVWRADEAKWIEQQIRRFLNAGKE